MLRNVDTGQLCGQRRWGHGWVTEALRAAMMVSWSASVVPGCRQMSAAAANAARAEANAARALVAQAFLKSSLSKPPTGTGDVRSATGHTPVHIPRDGDRAR